MSFILANTSSRIDFNFSKLEKGQVALVVPRRRLGSVSSFFCLSAKSAETCYIWTDLFCYCDVVFGNVTITYHVYFSAAPYSDH